MKKPNKKNILSDDEVVFFLGSIDRDEFSREPVVYSKAIRVSLLALGFDEDWVNWEFREMLETAYSYYFDEYNAERRKEYGLAND